MNDIESTENIHETLARERWEAIKASEEKTLTGRQEQIVPRSFLPKGGLLVPTRDERNKRVNDYKKAREEITRNLGWFQKWIVPSPFLPKDVRDDLRRAKEGTYFDDTDR